jgi:hypothetical protein
MRLIKAKVRSAAAGIPEAYCEWWDIGNNYEISVVMNKEICSLGIRSPIKNITYEVAKYLNIDTNVEKLSMQYSGHDELFITMGIDCVVLNYTKPDDYKELLTKIEVIVSEHFNNK